MAEGIESGEALKEAGAPGTTPGEPSAAAPQATAPLDEAKPAASAPSSEGAHHGGHGEEPTGVEAVVEDLFHIDFKLPRTVRDMVLRPGKVADAALSGDHSTYTRPLRVFLALVALQALVTGWLGYNDTGTFGVLFEHQPAALAHITARLAQAGSSLSNADDIIRHWTDWASWPLIMISSLLYALVIWATRPSLGLLKSTILYLVAAGASYAATLPLVILAGLAGPKVMALSAMVGFIALFAYAGAVLHKRVAHSAGGLVLRLAAFVLATAPVLLVGVVLVFGTIEIVFRSQTGLSRLQLLLEAYRIAR